MIPLLGGPAVFALAMTAFNLLTWPRGRPQGTPGKVSILVPARNEEASIEACVRAALAALPMDGELVVCDDHSTDRTPQILERLGAEPRLRVITPPPLPVGWVGKPHACHHLALAARGEHLLFVDADVTLAPDALRRLADLRERYDAEVISAFPDQTLLTAAEAHLMPLLTLTYTAWLPLALVWASPDPRFLAANGQVLMVSRDAYDRLGGFAAVRDAVVDDMAFCRRAKEQRTRVVFADGRDVARCRMYASGGALWRGFTKNLYEGLGERPERLAGAMMVYGWAFVLPYLALLLGATAWLVPGPSEALGDAASSALLVAGAVGVAANLATRLLLAGVYGHRLTSVLTHPLAVVTLFALALDSARRTLAGQITWAGRTYPRRADRGVE